MKRRGVLSAAVLVLGSPARAEKPVRAGEDLLGIFTDPAAARVLGRHALLAMPGTDAGTLAAALERDLAGTGPLRRRVAAASQRDFTAGRVTQVDGWMLATVEARLCALAALCPGPVMLSPGSGPT